jgi:outer membrane receptor protein involved in Fe transport
MMKYLYLSALLCCFFSIVSAQDEQYDVPAEKRVANRPARLYGRIVDSKTNKGIDAASVQIFVRVRDSITQTTKDSLIAGTLTKANGDFAFRNISLPDTFTVKFTAIGFMESTQTVSLEKGEAPAAGIDKDLGNIKLATGSDLLGTVTVTAQKPAVQMSIDRKVFNVDKSLTSTGGTAVDVMKNIPSVTVDVDGNVLLRNTSPQIFVDGRPTILTLEQIPADDIERVELITNPSSKFDAASSGGIINVILKKNRKLGLNGIVSAGVGTPDIWNGNLNLNLRKGKFNFFASGNYNQSGGTAKGETFRQNKVDGVRQDYFNQQSVNDRFRKFTSVRFGMDYFMDNRNTISLSQNFVNGHFKNSQHQDQQYYTVEKELTRTGLREADSKAQFYRSNTQLNYKHSFPKTGQELTADLTYNFGDGSNNASITNNFYQPDGSLYTDPNIVSNAGSDDNKQLTAQIDYVNPITESSKIEMGLRSFTNDYVSVFNAFSLTNGTEEKLPLSSNYKYRESIQAGYITYSNRFKGIKYQVGLRGEYSKFTGEMIDSALKFGYTLPENWNGIFDGLFPSVYLTHELSEGQELQLNFTRRIHRPNFWQMNPFFDISDPVNINVGNPALRPEYTNSFEFNYSHQYKNGNFMGSIYYRNNQDDITRYSDTITQEQYQKLNNAAIDPNAIANTFINADYTNRLGAEFTFQHKIGKNLEIIPNVNFQHRKVRAQVKDLNLSNEGFNWDGKLIVNYKLVATPAVLNNLNVQVTGQYESPEVIPQGKNKEEYSVDFALRKEFLKKNAAALTFSVSDVFNTRKFGTIYDTENFYQDSYRRWNVRSYRLTLTYRFGDKDFGLFKKNEEQKRDHSEE